MSKFLRRAIRYSGVTEVVQSRLRPMPKLSLVLIDLTIAVGKEDVLIDAGECRQTSRHVLPALGPPFTPLSQTPCVSEFCHGGSAILQMSNAFIRVSWIAHAP